MCAVPFVITMITALFVSSYLLLDPAHWLYDFMELTYMSFDFKVFILVVSALGFSVSYLSELFVFPQLAGLIGRVRVKMGRKKKRKEYKVVAEGMKF
jgi:cation-transporting ATPase 13A2